MILTTIKSVKDSTLLLIMSLCELRQLFAATTHWIISVLEAIAIDTASLLRLTWFTIYSSQAPCRYISLERLIQANVHGLDVDFAREAT